MFSVVIFGTNSSELGLSEDDEEAFWVCGVWIEEGVFFVTIREALGRLGVVDGVGLNCDGCNADGTGEKGCAVGLSLADVYAVDGNSRLRGLTTVVPSFNTALSSLGKVELLADDFSCESDVPPAGKSCGDDNCPFVAMEVTAIPLCCSCVCCCCWLDRCCCCGDCCCCCGDCCCCCVCCCEVCPVLWGGTSVNCPSTVTVLPVIDNIRINATNN